jgi:hypothetical protein
MPERQGLVDLARTSLQTQARLWPDLVGTAAVPAADVARCTIDALPALAVLDRCASAGSNDAQKEMWAAVDDVAQPAETKRATAGAKGDPIASLAYDRKAAARKAARNRDGAT